MKQAASFLIIVLLTGTPLFAGDMGRTAKSGPPAVQASMTGAGAPEGLHLKIVQNGLKLYWTVSPQDPGIVTGYEIVRSDRFSGPYETVAKVEKGTSHYIDLTASKEIIYFYKVRAIAGKEYSPFSNTVTGERM